MKSLVRFLFLIFVFAFSSNMQGQITNLLVNGSPTHFTLMSGGEMSWSYNLPVGGTALLEIWIDVNANSILEPATDILWQAFYQMDGQEGNNGPPDMDGLVNGQITFGMPIGLAPAEYIITFSNNSSTRSISGTITPLLSPVFTISGTVSVPAGKSAQYLILNLESSGENGGKFWTAITDVNGNYFMYTDADTSGNPWRLRIDNEQRINPAILSPDRINLTLDAGNSMNYSGNNFTFNTAAAEINGTVKDDDGNPVVGVDVYISGNDGYWNRNAMTDLTGSFSLGFLSNELPASNVWLGAGNSEDNSMVSAGTRLPTVYSGNVVTKNLTLFRTNATISGRVTLGGNSPNMNLEIMAGVTDTAFLRTYTDFNGYYTLDVSNKLYNYEIFCWNLPPNYMGGSILAHPGQTNVNLNFNLTDVQEDHSTIPSEFNLAQNYPNPFNPSTKISWQSPIGSWQTLKVYNVLGNEVATLVDEYKPAGNYEVEFDAAQLTSGIYFYKIQAGSFVETKKMVLLR
jgi:hypothetical protein